MGNPTVTPRRLRELHTTLEENIIPALVVLGIDPDYSPDSLVAMERAINRTYPQGSKDPTWPLIFPFGYYFGEVLVRNIPGAEWKLRGFDEIDVEEVEVRIPVVVEGEKGSAAIRPYMRSIKFWFDRTDSFKVVYDMFNAQSLGMFDPLKKEYEGPEWKQLGNSGNHIRVFRGSDVEDLKSQVREADKTNPFNNGGDSK